MSGKSRNIAFGRSGEVLAGAFLAQKGHRLLCANYRCGHKEIDLVSLDRGILVFTEIKTRSSMRFGFPEEAVTVKKQLLLKEAAASFLAEHPQYQQMRFDIVSIMLRAGQPVEILHFEDAFY